MSTKKPLLLFETGGGIGIPGDKLARLLAGNDPEDGQDGKAAFLRLLKVRPRPVEEDDMRDVPRNCFRDVGAELA